LKHLIVTGDDFGRSHEVNEAIERCHAAGFLTQASLMVNEPCADEAVRIAQRHPALSVGLHLTLCDGRATSVSALTNRAGRLTASPALAGIRYAFEPWLHRRLSHEIWEQFERFRSFGLPETYWDGHAHLHLHPVVLRLTLEMSHEQGFYAVRLVREPGPPALLPRVFDWLSRAAIPKLSGFALADHTFGLRDTGKITTSTAGRILRALPDGVSEFYFHPGAEPEELDCPALLSLIAERGIKLRTLLKPPAGH
jgi:hopanoid biosynthesis associated protein HpnK